MTAPAGFAPFTYLNTPGMFTYVDTATRFTYVDIMEQLNARTVPLLGKGVRQLRSARSLTQGEVAVRARVSRTWLSQLESGTRLNAELAAVMRVLEVLGARLTLTIEEVN